MATTIPWGFQEMIYIVAIAAFGSMVMMEMMNPRDLVGFLTLVPAIGTAFINIFKSFTNIMDAKESLLNIRTNLLEKIHVTDKPRMIAIKPTFTKHAQPDEVVAHALLQVQRERKREEE